MSPFPKSLLETHNSARVQMKNSYPGALCKFRGPLTKIAPMLGICAAFFAISPAFSATPVLGSAISSDGKTRVDILSLKRTEGETVTLRFQVTNDGNETYSVAAGNVRLVDMIGRRIYSPGLTSTNCSVPVGQQLACYAVFGTPPAGTQKMSVQFYEKLDMITGIPLSEQ
jgi:hypothetical protein